MSVSVHFEHVLSQSRKRSDMGRLNDIYKLSFVNNIYRKLFRIPKYFNFSVKHIYMLHKIVS